MKFIIIGSQGFIGSHLFDYFSKNNPTWGADIQPIDKPNYFYIDPEKDDFEIAFQNEKYDVCINASGNGLVSRSVSDPDFDYRLNTHNVYKILSNIRKYNPACKFIQLSSAAVYGNPVALPIHEDHPLNPISPYGYHKLITEELCRMYTQLFGVPTAIVRIFSVYGPRLQKQLFWDTYHKYLKNKQVELFGAGTESRDFIYIDDLVRAFDLIIQKSPFQADIYNAGSGEADTIRDVSTLFLSLLDKEAYPQFSHVTKAGDPVHFQADIQKLKDLGFTASTDLRQGLTHYIEWIKEKK